MSIEYCIPPDLLPRNKQQQGRVGVTQIKSAGIGGTPSGIDWEGASFPSYTVRPIIFGSSTNHLEQWEKFYDDTLRLTKPFWVHDPISRTHRWAFCGPETDGTRTTFPIPILDPSDVTVYVGAGPGNATVQASSTYTVHSACNTFDDDTAVAHTADSIDLAEYTGATSSLSRVTGVSRVGLASHYLDVTGSAVHGITATAEPATMSKEHTAQVSVLSAGADDITIAITWIDISQTPISTTTSTGNSTSASVWTTISLTATAPVLTVTAQVKVYTDSATTDDLWFDCLSFGRGDYDRWHLPSCAPGLIEFNSAPAADQRVMVTATGERLSRCSIDKPQGLGWSAQSPGHHDPRNGIVCREYPEVSW